MSRADFPYGWDKGKFIASDVTVDTDNFSGPLSVVDINVQIALESLDTYLSGLFNDGNLVLEGDKAIYLGDPDTEGTWRVIRSGNNLLVQRYESSVWVSKGGFSA